MPHKCAVCSKMYDNYALEIARGCDCGSKIFIYQKNAVVPKSQVKSIPEGSVPGPAAKEKINFIEEVKSALQEVGKGRKSSRKVEFDLDTIRVIEDGIYEIDINKILNNEPLIIEIKEDGKYFIHLASLFKEKLETLEKDHLEIKPKNKNSRKKIVKNKTKSKRD